MCVCLFGPRSPLRLLFLRLLRSFIIAMTWGRSRRLFACRPHTTGAALDWTLVGVLEMGVEACHIRGVLATAALVAVWCPLPTGAVYLYEAPASAGRPPQLLPARARSGAMPRNGRKGDGGWKGEEGAGAMGIRRGSRKGGSMPLERRGRWMRKCACVNAELTPYLWARSMAAGSLPRFVQKLTRPPPSAGDYRAGDGPLAAAFGTAVAVSPGGDALAVGAIGDAAGPGGDNAGAVYVYRRQTGGGNGLCFCRAAHHQLFSNFVCPLSVLQTTKPRGCLLSGSTRRRPPAMSTLGRRSPLARQPLPPRQWHRCSSSVLRVLAPCAGLSMLSQTRTQVRQRAVGRRGSRGRGGGAPS